MSALVQAVAMADACGLNATRIRELFDEALIQVRKTAGRS